MYFRYAQTAGGPSRRLSTTETPEPRTEPSAEETGPNRFDTSVAETVRARGMDRYPLDVPPICTILLRSSQHD